MSYGMNHGALDAWITGNWGYDHPDNQPEPERAICWDCRDEFDISEMEEIPHPKSLTRNAYLCEDCVEKWTCTDCGQVCYGDLAIERTGYCEDCATQRFDDIDVVFERGAA